MSTLDTATHGAEVAEDDEVDDYAPRDWQRFYMGYRERFVDNCVLELQGGSVKVQLSQAPSASCTGMGGQARTGGAKAGKRAVTTAAERDSDPALTGTTVWDGGVVLSQALTCTDWLQRHRGGQPWPSGDARPHCLELGAGTGAVGLSLAACHLVSSATITDIPEMLPHIESNVRLNASAIQTGPRTPKAATRAAAATAAQRPACGQGAAASSTSGPGPLLPQAPQVLVRSLRWGPPGDDIQTLQQEQLAQNQQRPAMLVQQRPWPGPPYDLIVGSDLIYYTYSEATPHTKLLLWTLQRVASPLSLIYLALSLHHNPEEVEHFLSLAEEAFEVTRLQKQVPKAWRVHDSLVVMLRLKSSSAASAEAPILDSGPDHADATGS